jgi:hypothetical protein
MRKHTLRRIADSLLLTSTALTLAACSAGDGAAPPGTIAEATSASTKTAWEYKRAPAPTRAASSAATTTIHPFAQQSTATVLQGLGSYTLVAGKTIAVRAYFADQATADAVVTAQVTVVRPDGGKNTVTNIPPQSNVIHVPSDASGGPSVVVTVAGAVVYEVGTYFLQTTFFDVNGAPIATFDNDDVSLLPTKDVRILVDRIWSGAAAAKPHEIQSAIDAVTRMSQVMPVRDDVSLIGEGTTAGLRYKLNDNPQPQDSDLPAVFAAAKNPGPGNEPCDTAMAYRFQDPGEGAGASTQGTLSGLPWALAVWGDPDHPDIAEVFTHETGHLYGLVPSTNPDFDGMQNHSKYETIQNGDEIAGFDVAYGHPYASPLHDLMFWEGDETNDAFAMNTWDWEYERQQILKLPSTGPTGPDVLTPKLGGTSLQGTTAIGVNADGRNEFYAIGGDGALYHRWETAVGGYYANALSGWAYLGGNLLGGSLRVVRQADERITVFAEGTDRRIYFRSQSGPNGGWPGAWTALSTMTVRGYDVGTNLDGRLEIQSVGDDGALYTIWQLAPNGGFSAPASLGGWGLAGPVALGRNADGRLQTFVVGGDAQVYSKWEPSPNTGPWSDWTSLSDGVMTNVAGLHVARTPDGRLSLVALRNDGSFALRAQAAPSGGFAAGIAMGGNVPIADFAVTSTNDGRLHVFTIGGDGLLWQDFQVDPARPELWSNWIAVSNKTFEAGVAAASYDSNNALELVGVESDGSMDWAVF